MNTPESTTAVKLGQGMGKSTGKTFAALIEENILAISKEQLVQLTQGLSSNLDTITIDIEMKDGIWQLRI